MNAKPLGRQPAEHLGREPGSLSAGGGPACIPPTVQPDASTPPFLFGFIAGTATFESEEVVGISFGADPLIPNFGTLLSPAVTGLDAGAFFHRVERSRSAYYRVVTSSPYAPEVAGISGDAFDRCNNGLEGFGITRSLEDEDLYGPEDGQTNPGFVAGQTYYIYCETY